MYTSNLKLVRQPDKIDPYKQGRGIFFHSPQGLQYFGLLFTPSALIYQSGEFEILALVKN